METKTIQITDEKLRQYLEDENDMRPIGKPAPAVVKVEPPKPNPVLILIKSFGEKKEGDK